MEIARGLTFKLRYNEFLEREEKSHLSEIREAGKLEHDCCPHMCDIIIKSIVIV